MANNRKPRKAHKPPQFRTMPIIFKLPSAEMIDLALMPHACIAAFAAGQATYDNAATLANCANMAAILTQKHSPAAMACAKAGQEAIIKVIERGASGKWGFSGDEYQAIKEAVTLYDQMAALATRREIRDVLLTLQAAA